MASNLPPTLEKFIDEILPLWQKPPDAEIVDGIANVYQTSTSVVWQAVRQRMPGAPVVPPAPTWIVPRDVTVPVPVIERTRERAPSSTDPYDRVINALRARGARIRPKRDAQGRESARTACPTHDDTKPSLVVTRDGGKALLKCFGGCRTSAIVAALGLKLADLFSGYGQPMTARCIEATYSYRAIDGTLLGEKVRYAPKAFRWQQHSPGVGPYRLPDLIDKRSVFLTEGEKACDQLWARGLASTCGPSGASTWTPDWSRTLWTLGCRELIVLSDNDAAGHAHAARVAAITYALEVAEPIAVKVVALPGLRYGGDIVDWLTEHTEENLDALVAATSTWSPERVAQEREAHRKALRKLRNQRYRQSHRTSREAGFPPAGKTLRMSASNGETHRMLGETLRRETLPNVLQGTSQKEVSRDLSVPHYQDPDPEVRTQDDHDDGNRR